MMASIYVPVLQGLLHTVALPPVWFWAMIAFGFVNIILVEFTKRLFRQTEV
jgi:hypothetical protein